MKAEALNCPNCGAATSSDAPHCQFCNSRLATILCSSCFGLMFVGSKHCQRCGAAGELPSADEREFRNCPRCSINMRPVKIGVTEVDECERCFGLWVDVPAFEKICADREQQSAVLGGARNNSAAPESKVNYVPCPQCSQLMNRINFARCSGVVVDVCKRHGTWFDRDELSRIVEFISGGGMNAARARERIQIAEEREQLRQERLALEMRRGGFNEDDQRLGGIASAGGILKLFLG